MLAESAGAGRALDPLRADLVATCSTPASRCRSRRAGELILPDARALVDGARRRRRASTCSTLCVGRTHGIHAEPTTFGIKLAGFAFEAHRNVERLERAFAQASVGALSGAVGTYSATSPEFERRVLERLGLQAEPVSTQVVPRDRHAELLQAIALAGAGLERLATEIRHLARTELSEAREPFARRPEGLERDAAQAQPDQVRADHRPRAAAARLRRRRRSRTSRSGTSATSRTRAWSAIVLPDATILLDHMQRRMLGVIRGLVVDAARACARTST